MWIGREGRKKSENEAKQYHRLSVDPRSQVVVCYTATHGEIKWDSMAWASGTVRWTGRPRFRQYFSLYTGQKITTARQSSPFDEISVWRYMRTTSNMCNMTDWWKSYTSKVVLSMDSFQPNKLHGFGGWLLSFAFYTRSFMLLNSETVMYILFSGSKLQPTESYQVPSQSANSDLPIGSQSL